MVLASCESQNIGLGTNTNSFASRISWVLTYPVHPVHQCWLRTLPISMFLPRTSTLDRVRSFMTSAARGHVVDDMIHYALSTFTTGHDQAVDVLRSGLASQAEPEKGVHAGRLYLTMAELERERSNWSAAVDLAASASKAARAEEPGTPEDAAAAAEVELAAYAAGTRAYLAQGKDFEALDLAKHALDIAHASFHQKGAEQQRWRALTQNNSLVGLVHHAMGDLPAATTAIDAAQALADHADERRGHLFGQRDAEVPCALHRIAALRLAAGEHAEALTLFTRAAAAAEERGEEGGQGAGGAAVSSCMSPIALRELHASSLGGVGRVATVRKDWETAEDIISKAVTAADRVSRAGHPRVVPLLSDLGLVFARTARVMYAEGMYRKAINILGLDPAKGEVPHSVHSSVAAQLGWRYAQLLGALPKRGTEAEAWQAYAEKVYGQSSGLQQAGDIAAVLGGLHSLQDKGSLGTGAVADLTIRRLLPCI